MSLTVDGAASSDLIVQVRHQGYDGLVGLSETHFPSISDEWSYESLHDGSVLRIGGLGVVGLGMPLADAERWGGIPMAYDRGEHCTTLSPVDRPPGVSFISTRGEDRVDVITVEAPGVRTREGIGVGSTEAEVRQAYPGAEERGGPGLVLVLRADPGRDEMVFRIVDGEVASIWTGADGLSLTDELCA